MPYTAKQKHLFGLCSSPAGRAKARVPCPPMSEAKKLAHEAAQYPELKAARKQRRDPRYH